ncbi:unnamed protein product [Urochloa humidicola]
MAMPHRSADLPVADPDAARLQQLGYKQELKRGISVISNFAFSFSMISVMMGVTTTYNTGLRYGGPASMTLGWLVMATFNGCVAMSMAEICSAYPTSGGLYYWSAKLAGKNWSSLASWTTGWFNIVGQWASTTSIYRLLAGATCPSDHPTRHWWCQWWRLPGLQILLEICPRDNMIVLESK